MDSENLFPVLEDLNLRIANLKDALLTDVDMPEDVAEFQLSRLKEMEAQRNRML